MQPVSSIVRVIIGIMAGLILIFLMPIYEEPFGGCQAMGFATFVLGCSLWPDLALGFSLVLLVSLIGGTRRKAALWGIALVVALAIVGGPSGLKSGMPIASWSQPSDLKYFWFGSGTAVLMGGVLGSLLYWLLVRIYYRSSPDIPKDFKS